MRQKLLWLRPASIVLLIVALAVVGTLSFTGRAQQASRTTWEYKVISAYGPSETTPPPDVAQLDKAGTEGWELIDVRVGKFPGTHKPESEQVRTDYYFKRAK